MSISISSLIQQAPEDAIVSAPNPMVTVQYIATIDDLYQNQKRDTLYVGQYRAKPPQIEVRDVNILMYSEEFVDIRSFPSSCNLILLRDYDTYLTLLGSVLKMVNENARLNKINNELMEIVSGGGSIQKLLNYGCHVLENPLMMVDISFRYVASAGIDDLSDEPTWKSTVENGIMPKNYLARIMSTVAVYLESEGEPSQIIVVRAEGDDVHDSFSVKIMHGGTMYGYLKMIDKYSEFTEFDHRVLVLLGKYAGIMRDNLLQLYNFNENTAENLLTSILLNKIESNQAAEALSTLAPSRFMHNLYIVNIEFEQQTTLEDTIFYSHMRIKRFFPKNIVSIVNGGYVVLVDVGEEDVPGFMRPEFQSLLTELKCFANISLVFHDLQYIYTYFQQTKFCNEYRRLTGSRNPIINYQDIYEYQMIMTMSEKIDLRSVIHPVVHRLLREDRQFETDYTNTLFAYVRNNLNISDTAKDMHFHYNTIKYRIQKISEITGFDPTDKEALFQINLSEKMLHLLRDTASQ